MRIDRSLGYYGFWVNETFYRFSSNPRKRIQSWLCAKSRLKESTIKINAEIETIRKHGYKYCDPEIKIASLTKKNETHARDIEHITSLIRKMDKEFKFHKHAKKMIECGIIQDDYYEKEEKRGTG